MKKKLYLSLVITFAVFILAVINFAENGSASKGEGETKEQHASLPASIGEAPVFSEASVHDPSVIKVDDTFYVFGSHLASAKTQDLMQWEQLTTHVHNGNKLIPNVYEELAEAFEWANSDTLWAADVRQLEDGKFYMYYNACQGDSPRSALGVAVADDIEGPYKDLGIFLKSGMWGEPSEDGTIYDARVHPNTIDPHTFFDKEGDLWMVYGSYSGGIFILEMDKATGFPLPGQGYGTHLMGGNHSRIEGPYIQYSPETDYYYLYVTFGGLDVTGGYNMRVARSEHPDGPYYDAEGNLMSDVKSDPDLPLFDDRSIEPYAVKQMGNFLFKRYIGDPGTGSGTGYVSPGHNSIYYDEETKQMFLLFHSRFPETGEMHQIRVHQMFMNEAGWPVVAPYRYAGETLEKINRQDIAGDYKLINHGKDISAEIKESVYVTLETNNKMTGAVSGKWKKTSHYQAEFTIDGTVYNGIFLRQWDPDSESVVMTFTALSNEGEAIWGSRVESLTDNEVVEAVKADLSIADSGMVIADLELPLTGTRNTEISWSSSQPDIISDQGVVRRPAAGEEDAVVALTATITKGSVTATKSFSLTVPAQSEGRLAAHYSFDGTLEDSSGNAGAGTITGDRINNEGGTISYADGVSGQAAVFDGASGVRLPDGLISGNTYTVSLWLHPDELTMFTTAFFGARTDVNWISLVPRGHDGVNNDTMLWSNSGAWYDAGTGVKVETGKWTHVAFTVDSGQLKIYIDGVERFSGTGFPNVFTSTNALFALGVNYWDPPFKGKIDEVMIFQDTVLSAEEITELAQQP
ncbi:arabinan endo-1,5-alpha-L-arabinosidase [Evansella caseinilytica]|uniref:Arabinan endo-1,5-alpha-L-arabinosidase n=1 Tax=Evansella caseinilytica TaxID=1503961 RepID=A0A1H3TCG9_9BACI|nr:LamG-like jellyroll fold domain-containing protein [Evansella caseinilytica]SDZ47962.1 arabinan endo-1,5-alpha-L-arabinosidase [Evansella caseinilytica]